MLALEANEPEGRSEDFLRARCGKTARRVLYGGGWVTGHPTAMVVCRQGRQIGGPVVQETVMTNNKR